MNPGREGLLALLLVLLLLLQLASAGMNRRQQDMSRSSDRTLSPSLSECAAKQGECDDSEGPVCGTDDQTYPTRCHLQRVQCSGHQVSLKHRGNCKGCLSARQYAERERLRDPNFFLPRCRRDGYYAAVQCLGTSECWCSDIYGSPIKNTSTRWGKPKCGRWSKNNRRRSPLIEGGNSSEGIGGGHRPCNRTDRMQFNSQLIEEFRSEQQLAGSSDAQVLDWKFNQLDTNGNQVLDRQEVRELKKLLKRTIKPRRCGRAFGKYCNVNKDDYVSRQEWSNCLARDAANLRKPPVSILNSSPAVSAGSPPRRTHYTTNLHTTPIHHTNPHNDHTNTNTIGSSSSSSSGSSSGSSISLGSNHPGGHGNDFSNESEEYDYVGEDEDDTMTHSRTSPLSPSSFNFLNAKTESTNNNESEGDANCWTEVAHAEQRHGGNSSLYVPECMPDGRYKRVQCYSSFCWCVNEETGKNIPGTFGQKRPQCDDVSPVRPMKGCTGQRKTQFLRELKVFLDSMLPNMNSSRDLSNWKSEDERIATMSFVSLDKNKSKFWERKEWKVFRDLVTGASHLSKCGKKMPRYCDANGDKKISLAEWRSCMEPQRAEVTTTVRPAQSSVTVTPRLIGSNPLEQYLRDY